jgi:hypothetical protein
VKQLIVILHFMRENQPADDPPMYIPTAETSTGKTVKGAALTAEAAAPATEPPSKWAAERFRFRLLALR